ncbi:TetR/AcrR family transcriptional regulator [Azospirillum sp. sgz302134]
MSTEPIAAPPSPPKPDPKTDPKTERILAASKETFLELGYAATSMDLVAQRARVSKTTLYTRFPSKEELFVATIHAECEQRGMRFTPDAFDGMALEEALRCAGRRFVDLIWSREAMKVHQIVLGEAARFPELAQLYFQAGPEKGIDCFTALFERLVQRGLADIEEPAFAAIQFLAALQGGSHCALELGLCDFPPDEERDAFVRKAVALFVRGIGPGR